MYICIYTYICICYIYICTLTNLNIYANCQTTRQICGNFVLSGNIQIHIIVKNHAVCLFCTAHSCVGLY